MVLLGPIGGSEAHSIRFCVTTLLDIEANALGQNMHGTFTRGVIGQTKPEQTASRLVQPLQGCIFATAPAEWPPTSLLNRKSKRNTRLAFVPTMEDWQLLKAWASSKPQRPLLPAPTVNLIPSKRTTGVITQSQWQSAEPLIRRLYLVEKKPYKHVADILQHQYGFHPTKRQFERKVREGWGMKKYTTDVERGDLIRKRKVKENEQSLFESSIANQSPSLVNLNRWKENLARTNSDDRSALPITEMGDLTQVQLLSHMEYTKTNIEVEVEDSLAMDIEEGDSNSPAKEISVAKQIQIPTPEESILDVVDDCSQSPGIFLEDQTTWDTSRILDSPELNTLFSTLKICGVEIPDEEISSICLTRSESSHNQEKQYMSKDDIRDLHNPFLTSKRHDSSTASGTFEPPYYDQQQQQQCFLVKDMENHRRPLTLAIESFTSPLSEIYPFPTSRITSIQAVTPKMTDLHKEQLECEARLQKLQGVLPVTNVGVRSLMERLSDLYYDQRNFKAELALRHILITANKEIFGANDPRTLLSQICFHESMASLSVKNAMSSHHPLHETLLREFSLDNELVIRSTNLMSHLYLLLRQINEAEKSSRQALQMCLNVFGPRDKRTLVTMWDLASALVDQGGLSQSEHLLRAAIQLYHETIGSEESAVRFDFRLLAGVFNRQGKLQESADLCRRSLEHSRAKHGDDHPETLCIMAQLASLLGLQGCVSEGKDLLQKAVLRMIETLGENDLDTLWAMIKLASLLKLNGKYEDAAKYYKPAFKGRIHSLGIENPVTISACLDLGVCYEEQGLYEEASELYQSTIEEIKATCSEDHPSVERIQRYMSRLQMRVGDKGLEEDIGNGVNEESDEETNR
ncbi:hypothetical protein G7Y89_g12729 [Cudoniella acicularis]|uniref:Clr5 domain-containing protein n=1 Tax=Cudoniella acicularis TaxID=354080 RepID=A0A8H4VX34_9HELO|nr:hypothetical protein G7Y89_g12729 [Cudoniella acicularis]